MTVTINGTTGIANDGGYTGDGVVFADTTPANTLVTTTGGNVGIGTSSPNIGGANTDNAILTLKGKASTRGGIFEMGNFGTTGNDQTLGWNRYFDGSTENASIEVARASSTSTAYIKFSTNGGSGSTERARIDSSGNLLVGTTSGAFSSTTSTGMQVGQSGQILCSTTGTSAIFRITSTGTLVQWRYQGTVTGDVTTNGTTTAYNTSSDYRLKENIAPMTGALAKVVALKPCTYTWKNTGEADEGFIAHELQEVCPSAVTGEKDAVDAEGNPQYQGIDTSFLVATLTAAIQELKAIVDAQGAEIAALKGQP